MIRRILIADDHVAIREGIEVILGTSLPECLCEMACTPDELRKKVGGDRWDLLLLEPRMTGGMELDFIRYVKDVTPTTGILIYTEQPEDQLAVRVLRAGANGYLTKEASAVELQRAVRRVLEGRRYISESMAEKMADLLSQPAGVPLHASLSDREYQILKLLGNGVRPSTIGEQLRLSVKTISSYRKRILEKLHLNSTAALIRYVVEHNIR